MQVDATSACDASDHFREHLPDMYCISHVHSLANNCHLHQLLKAH